MGALIHAHDAGEETGEVIEMLKPLRRKELVMLATFLIGAIQERESFG
jgi:hypothetical protein